LIMGRSFTDNFGNTYSPQSAVVDGNMLRLALDKPAIRGSRLSVDIGGISDNPSVRWTTPNIAVGVKNTVAAGTAVTLEVR